MFNKGDWVRLRRIGWVLEIGDVVDEGQTLLLKVEGEDGLAKVRAVDAEPIEPHTVRTRVHSADYRGTRMPGRTREVPSTLPPSHIPTR